MFMSLHRTHCRKTGIGAEMLWVRLRSIIPAELLTLVESKTSRFCEVGTENAGSRWEPAQIPEWFLRIAVSSLGVATGESPGKNTDESPF